MARKAKSAGQPAEPTDDPTTAWCQDTLSGKIVSGKLAIAAAERHMRDLRDGQARGLHWRPDDAARALGFFPAVLSVTAGAAAGKPFVPLPWHTFTIGSLFGWRRADGMRRFRTAWLETGKGQAKSPLMAGIGLYLLGYCRIARPEIYAIAGDKDQANVLFRDGVAMCRSAIPGSDPMDGDTLESRGEMIIRGTGDMSWKIEHPASGGKFQSLASGDSISGPRPVAVLADEIHEFKSDKPIEIWAAAIAKMPGDPIMILGTNTPAIGQIVGTDYSEYYQRVAKGEFADDSSFAYIARTDPKDSPLEDESCWQKSLPALGITYSIENVRTEVAKARGLGGKRNTVLRLFFGVPVGATEFWIDEDAWQSCQGTFTDDDVAGLPCFLGMDLSQRNDLTALAMVWKRQDGRMFARVRYWKPAGLLLRAISEDKAPYDRWRDEGVLSVVPGMTINKRFVVAAVAEECQLSRVEAMAFDQAHVQDFLDAAAEDGFAVWEYRGPGEPIGAGLKMIRHAQGVRGLHSERMLWMPRSVQAFEDAILSAAITIEESALTTWCAANSAVVIDPAGNRFFDKKRSRGRIDGMVALAMAIGAATTQMGDGTLSIWDRPELWADAAQEPAKPAAGSIFDRPELFTR